jgi:sigma-B regulation protein RsbU (phosphoserine phosphatase)
MAVRLDADIEDIAQHANDQLGQDLPPGRFITAWLGELDAARGTLRSLSAGQGPLLLVRAATGEVVEVETDFTPLGLGEVQEAGAGSTIEMHAGDVFAALSDGIFEARNADDQEFGMQRTSVLLCDAVRNHATAREIIDLVQRSVLEFLGSVPASDDQTAIIVRRTA